MEVELVGGLEQIHVDRRIGKLRLGLAHTKVARTVQSELSLHRAERALDFVAHQADQTVDHLLPALKRTIACGPILQAVEDALVPEQCAVGCRMKPLVREYGFAGRCGYFVEDGFEGTDLGSVGRPGMEGLDVPVFGIYRCKSAIAEERFIAFWPSTVASIMFRGRAALWMIVASITAPRAP